MAENKRKCFKCSSSPAKDNVKLFRFPKPAVRNLLRCTLWAKYIFPTAPYSSIAFQTKLHNEHRMLCQRHFSDEDFTDGTKQKLKRNAFPYDAENTSAVCPALVVEPQAGSSKQEPQRIIVESQVDPPQRTPLRDIVNVPTSRSATIIEPQCGDKFKTEKEQCLYAKCMKHMRTVCQLRSRIKNLKKKVVLNIINEDSCIKKLSEKITPTFALLLQSQIRNFKKKSTGRRWSKEEKIVALRLYKRSPTCYRLLRRLFQLPSPGTLKALLNRVPFAVGFTESVFKVLKHFIRSQQPSDNEYILMFDEMSLRKRLQYNPKEDSIEGYQDHGTQGRSPLIAKYALVFMIAGIRKNVKQPIAHYFSSGFSTADRLAVLIKEVLQQCFNTGINISATVCDMDGVNRRALSILGASLQHPYIIVNNKEIVTIFDTPHLLKCFRNLFMKYDIECITNISSENKIGRGVAKWSHIKEFFEVDNTNPNFVFAPGITKEHVYPNTKEKMRVKLAAQVLSHTVAAGLYAKISDGMLTADAAVTANVVNNMDKLFDSLNSDTADLRRGKIHATNLTLKTPHMKFFEEMKTFFKTMKFVGCSHSPPSQDGWIWTITAIERLFQNLIKAHNVKSLATRRLQQDPIENLFGVIRGNCGSNVNPTTGQFVAALKTSILSSLAHIGTSGNCETDNNVIINNFDTLLSVSQPTCKNARPEFLLIYELPQDDELSKHINEDSAEVQACAYVCGFLLKKLPIDCDNCKNIFISHNVDKTHLFVECREYSEFKKSLLYATKDFVACVEWCASIINKYLQEKGHTTCLKKNIIENVKGIVNLDFIKKCATHRDNNIDIIINSVFMICVKRFCILKNRQFVEEASASALKRKMNIIMHK